MRNFANRLRLSLLVALIAAGFATAVAIPQAQETRASALFEDARALERTLRQDIGAYKAGTPALPLVRRARVLVGTYEDLNRLFPDDAIGDKALWQALSLAADVFDVFKDPIDRASAIRLTTTLTEQFPASTLSRQAATRAATLAPAPAQAPVSSSVDSTDPSAAPLPTTAVLAMPPGGALAAVGRSTSPDGVGVRLRTIRRDALADVLRVSLELDGEVTFVDDRLDGPPRVYIDLHNTQTSPALRHGLTFDDDVVRAIRVGRQLDRRTRVVFDLAGAPAHSVYTLYNPFRIVIDFERPRASVPPGTVLADSAVNGLSASRTAGPVAKAPAVRPPLVAVPARAPAKATAKPPTALPIASPPRTPNAAAVASAGSPSVTTPGSPSTISDDVSTGPVDALPSRDVAATPAPARTPGGLSIARQLGLGISRVVIDPGHGGHDPGAKQDKLTEADLVLDVALRLEQLLQKEGIEVILTRRTNVYVPLEDRPALAIREDADLYLSIHANASADRRIRGVETYVLNFASNARSAAFAARENTGSSRRMSSLPDVLRTIALNSKIEESRDFARQVQASLVEKLSKNNRLLRDLGVKQAPFAVLVGADMPSILAEIAFISNKQDVALVKTAAYRQQIAEGLAYGILRYQQRLKPAQVASTERTK